MYICAAMNVPQLTKSLKEAETHGAPPSGTLSVESGILLQRAERTCTSNDRAGFDVQEAALIESLREATYLVHVSLHSFGTALRWLSVMPHESAAVMEPMTIFDIVVAQANDSAY